MALSDPAGILASPHRIINSSELDADITTILAIAAEQGVGEIVVGLPVSLDGREHGQAARIREFAAALARRTEIPIVFHDERFSSVTAANLRRATGKKKHRGRRQAIDDAAAAVILQEYLDQQRGIESAAFHTDAD